MNEENVLVGNNNPTTNNKNNLVCNRTTIRQHVTKTDKKCRYAINSCHPYLRLKQKTSTTTKRYDGRHHSIVSSLNIAATFVLCFHTVLGFQYQQNKILIRHPSIEWNNGRANVCQNVATNWAKTAWTTNDIRSRRRPRSDLNNVNNAFENVITNTDSAKNRLGNKRSSKQNEKLNSLRPSRSSNVVSWKLPQREVLKSNTFGVAISADMKKYYDASYYISYKSQKLIKDASANTFKKNAVERATSILKTFLAIPPQKCNAANLVCALTLSAKVVRTETSVELRTLLYRTTDILLLLIDRNKLSARQLCNAVWAIAKHFDRDPDLLPTTSQLEPTSIDNVIMLDLTHDEVEDPARRLDDTIDKIALKLTSMLNEDHFIAKESELCMASWAFGILRRRRRPTGWKDAPKISKVPGTTNSFETLTRQQPNMISYEVLKSDNDYEYEDSYELSESRQSVSAACPTGDLFDKISEALCTFTFNISQPYVTESFSNNNKQSYRSRLEVCTWSELANLVWAFASHGHSHTLTSQTLLSSIASEACCRLDRKELNSDTVLSRDIAQTLWSLGTLQADNYLLAGSLVKFTGSVTSYTNVKNLDPSERPLRDWSCTDIVQVASSLAHARLDEVALLTALYAESQYRLDTTYVPNGTNKRSNLINTQRVNFLPFEVSVLLWAQARMHLTYSTSFYFDEFTKKAVRTLNNAIRRSSFDKIGIGAQEQANIAWSLTVLENYSTDGLQLLEKIFTEAAKSCQKEGIIQLEHAHQLWQALCLLEENHPEIVNNVPNWFRSYLEDKWQLEKSRTKISSARHRALSETLELMGISHYNEHDEDIDVAIILKPQANWLYQTDSNGVESDQSIRIAVEFDGPNHFTRQTIPNDGSKPLPPRALGHTVLKYRQLKIQGWTVVRVPYYEFDKIPFWASMERQRYIQRLLKTHGNIRFSNADVSHYKPQNPSRMSRYD
jgi:RAP domain